MQTTNRNSYVPTNALLLCPDAIPEKQNPYKILQIHTTAPGKQEFQVIPFNTTNLLKLFFKYPAPLKESLTMLSDEHWTFSHSQWKKKHQKEKTGWTWEKYLDKCLGQYYYGHLDVWRDINKAGLLMYHRYKDEDTGRFVTRRCHLSPDTPQIEFSVEKRTQGLFLKTEARTTENLFTLSRSNRYLYMVRDGHAYSCLSPIDYQNLQWLDNSRPEQYALSPGLLAQRILVKLEERYKVDKHDHFPVTVIDKAPACCLYLNEIGDSMLMLTPKWDYEGILVEGAYKGEHDTTRNGKPYRILRHADTETRFLQYLRSLHPSFAKQTGDFFYLGFADAQKKQWFLKTYHALLKEEVELIGLELLRHFRYSPHAPSTTMSVLSQEKDAVTLEFQVTFGEEPIDLKKLQALLLSGQASILLKDSTIGIFDEEWLKEYAPLVKHGKITSGRISLPRWILLSLQEGAAKSALSTTVTQEWMDQWMRWQTTGQIYMPPAGLTATLRAYQHKGFEWLSLLSEIGAGACLADDMGLGKSLQTIAYFCWKAAKDPGSRFIISCPASLLYNWQQELGRFAPSLGTYVWEGPKGNMESFFHNNATVLICSLGTLRSQIDQIKLISWDAAVIDESHNIKNYHAQTTKAAFQLLAGFRIALSGTPIMNNTLDLYAQLHYMVPGLFGGQDFFNKEYAHPIDHGHDEQKVKALHKITAPFILRRTKKQVAQDLPEKTESVLWCHMAEGQRKAYDDIKAQIRDSVFLNIRQEGLAKSKLSILQGMMKLRQACCSPALIPGHEGCQSAIKTERIIEELEMLREHKSLVFSQFKGMLKLIAEACTAAGIPYYLFDGDTPLAERQSMVDSFQQEGDPARALLISLKSGNSGLNLTAADYVFLIDPWWNTAVQQQAIDRTHRIGQTKEVFAYKMICKDTIEEKILALQQQKRQLADDLIVAEEGFVKNLSLEEIDFLFS